MSKVAEILEAMAANAGRAQLARGALIGGTIADVSQLPAIIANDRDKAKLEALKTAQVQQQMGLEASRGRREDQLATSAQAQAAKEQQTQQHLSTIIGAGFSDDPSKFDVGAANKKAMDLGRADLIPTVAAVHDKLQPKLTPNVDPDKNVIDPTGKIVVPASTAKPKNEAELAADAANPTSPTQAQSVAAMALLKPKPSATAEQDDAKYREIQARAAQKLPVLPAEQAWSDAYEKQKTLTTDKSAGAAADRAATATTAQTAQQKRAQDFAALQAARGDLEKNVNTPYLTAKTSANTLRDVVDAAKAGNTVAGSLQSLEATMAAIRAQGLNRINTAEIGATGNAGSLFQNIEGWLGKKAEGQPVPASVQKDMQDFATILEKAAYKKYQAGHAAVNSLYGTSIPEMLTGPEGYTPPALTPGLAGVAGRK